MIKIFLKISRYLSERLPLEKMNLKSMLFKKEVPNHAMKWAYFFGGLALLFFIIQLLTGLLLLVYYQPTVQEANDSVKFITGHVPGGSIIRNIHAWSSSAMVLIVILHLLTTFAMKAFEKPRELTWLTGVFLLFITYVFAFTGHLLPWHQLSVNATKIGLQFIGAVSQYSPKQYSHIPVQLVELIQGGPSVGQEMLSRFFSIHVVVLPLFVIFILGLHLFMVQVHGMSKGADGETSTNEKFFPDFLIKDLSLWALVFFILFVLAVTIPYDSFFPYPLVNPYNPLSSTPEGVKLEWYFFFIYYPMELLPYWIILLGITFIIIVLFLVPRIFARTTRKTLRFLAIIAFSYFSIVTIWGQKILELIKGTY